MDHAVSIPWNDSGQLPWNNSDSWQQAYIRAIELFGLPGDRFTARHYLSDTLFVFATETDAVVFALATGGVFVEDRKSAT